MPARNGSVGAPREEDREGEQDNPGQQTEGQAAGETPPPASDRLSRRKERSGRGSPKWEPDWQGSTLAFRTPYPAVISFPGQRLRKFKPLPSTSSKYGFDTSVRQSGAGLGDHIDAADLAGTIGRS